MDFELTEEQRLFQRTVREFMDRECPREYVRRLDEEARYPYELYARWVQQGWLGLPFPEEYGGSNASVVMVTLLTEELSRRGYEIGAIYSSQIYCGLNILRHGTAMQKAYYLLRLIGGEMRFATAITEPNAGSDAAALATSAVSDGDAFVLNGQKVFSTGADLESCTLIVGTRTGPALPKHKGLSVLLVPNTTPGVQVRRLRTLGCRIFGLNEIFFQEARVPEGNLLGELNGGWGVLLSHLELERLLIAVRYVGNAQTVVEEALAYTKTRQQFGQPIGQFQALAHILADMQTEVDAARLLVYRAACLIDQQKPALREVAMAKLYASETFVRAANNGMQIMGAYGYMMEYDMQRHFREARHSTIGGGTSQIQRNIIARTMGL